MNKTEEIIKVAIEGGYDKDKTVFSIIPNNEELDGDTGEVMTMFIRSYWLYPKLFLDPLFFQAIGKTQYKGWGDVPSQNFCGWLYHAQKFHEINLTQSFDDAINYLYELIK